MTKKTIDTLVEDIYQVLDKGVEIDQAKADEFGKKVGDMIKDRIERNLEPRRPFKLSMSQLGKPAIRLYHESKGFKVPAPEPSAKMKFLYGDLIEELLLFLCELAGHEVTDQQKRVTIDGINGHMDAKIDGVTVDVKSASSIAFKKFKERTLFRDDPFGYISQVSGYAQAEKENETAFLAMDKTLGHITLMKVSEDEMDNVPARITYLKNTFEQDTPPSKLGCQALVTEKNGNVKLGAKCSYCPVKKKCHPDMRTFIYSTGPKFLVEVVKEPRVDEVKDED